MVKEKKTSRQENFEKSFQKRRANQKRRTFIKTALLAALSVTTALVSAYFFSPLLVAEIITGLAAYYVVSKTAFTIAKKIAEYRNKKPASSDQRQHPKEQAHTSATPKSCLSAFCGYFNMNSSKEKEVVEAEKNNTATAVTSPAPAV